MNELEQFLSGIPSDGGQPLAKEEEVITPAPAKEGEVTPEEGEETPEVRKNRRERRFEDKMKQKDEMLVALNDRVKELSEIAKSNSQIPSEMPAEWVALMGDTPEAQKAWKLQESMIRKATENAKAEAVKEIEIRQQKSLEEQKQNESLIDNELESLEDEFNIDLTSNAPSAKKARREFLELVQKISPKDASGGIISYADFGTTFELYQNTKAQGKANETATKQKEIAARSMQQSGAVDLPKEEEDATRNWLRQNGIRV